MVTTPLYTGLYLWNLTEEYYPRRRATVSLLHRKSQYVQNNNPYITARIIILSLTSGLIVLSTKYLSHFTKTTFYFSIK